MKWRHVIRHAEFGQGLRDMGSVAPGLASWGMMTGVAMVKSGMSLFEALAMTFIVYAGSSQLAAIPLIAAGAPLLVIWATSFCVNLRFVVYSAHLRPYLVNLPRMQRLFMGYVTADLSYVMFTRRYPQPPQTPAEQGAQLAYLAGGCAACWLSWQIASLIGIGLAQVIPPAWGLSFAGILALVGVACSVLDSPLKRVSAVIAGTAAVAAFALPYKLNIVVAIAASVALCMLLENTRFFKVRTE
jgi:predicted branched-subunit amino acid permease